MMSSALKNFLSNFIKMASVNSSFNRLEHISAIISLETKHSTIKNDFYKKYCLSQMIVWTKNFWSDYIYESIRNLSELFWHDIKDVLLTQLPLVPGSDTLAQLSRQRTLNIVEDCSWFSWNIYTSWHNIIRAALYLFVALTNLNTNNEHTVLIFLTLEIHLHAIQEKALLSIFRGILQNFTKKRKKY